MFRYLPKLLSRVKGRQTKQPEADEPAFLTLRFACGSVVHFRICARMDVEAVSKAIKDAGNNGCVLASGGMIVDLSDSLFEQSLEARRIFAALKFDCRGAVYHQDGGRA